MTFEEAIKRGMEAGEAGAVEMFMQYRDLKISSGVDPATADALMQERIAIWRANRPARLRILEQVFARLERAPTSTENPKAIS